MGKYTITTHLTEHDGGRRFQTLQKICPFEVVMYGHKRDYKWTPNVCTYLEDNTWELVTDNAVEYNALSKGSLLE